MSNPKLELTWIGKPNHPRPQPRIRVDVAGNGQSADSGPRLYEATLDICGGPRCPCLNILFRWAPVWAGPGLATGQPSLEFWLALGHVSVVPVPESPKDPPLERLAEIIRAELTEVHQQQLREWYLAAKLDLIQSTPVSHIDLAGLPDAEGGKLIGIVDVFPCGGIALNFTLDGEAWAVDEQYCVQLRCRCTETVLSFLRLAEATGKKPRTIRQAPTLRYNYLSGATELMEHPAGWPSPKTLLAVIKESQPDLDLQLERRHLILKALYARHHQAQARRQALSSTSASKRSFKVGRNDPCPCGSGRKYKHCCLDKRS